MMSTRLTISWWHSWWFTLELKRGAVMNHLRKTCRLVALSLVLCGVSGVSRAALINVDFGRDADDGYVQRGRKTSYYTFRDFFIQTSDEVPLEGVWIQYQIRYNAWWDRSTRTRVQGDYWQLRSKRRGGRWTNYDLRVRRPVVYLGINRLVPHVEKSPSRSYSHMFSPASKAGWEDDLRSRVGRVMGRT